VSRIGPAIRANPLLSGAIFAGLAARIVYWAVTDRRLDDALITLKHAKNVADGVGLTHHLGEGGPVHGFTSVLSVLVPLPGELIADGGGLLTLRLASLVAFVFAAIYAARICRHLSVGAWPMGFALAYLALDQNQIFYGVAGMETQIAVAVLLAGIYYLLAEDQTKTGIALGLAILARPDFVLWVAPVFVYLLFHNRDAAARAWLWTLAIVGPWVLFATIYYGSPIPNTIIAKSQAFAPDFPSLTDIGGWFHFAWTSLKAHQSDWTTLTPFVERSWVLHAPYPDILLKAIGWSVGALAIVGAVFSWRERSALRPAIVFVLLWIAYRIAFLTVGYFEWYGVPIVAVIIIFAAIGLDRITVRRSVAFVAVPATVLGLAYAAQLPFTLPLEARIQQIEDQVRQPLGEYLGRVAKVGDTIVAEPSGYFGYWTNATLLDDPGLTSKRVTDALGDDPPDPTIAGLVNIFRPDWLALRPGELALVQAAYPDVAREYEPVREFSVSEADSPLDRWGLSLVNFDRDFIVLRRTTPDQ
jgi:hypothetical protein